LPAAAPPTAPVDVGAGLDWLAGLGAAGRLTPAQVTAVVAAGRGGATVHVLADARSEQAAAVIAAVTAAGGRATRLDAVGPR
jgi:hypothetical protein